MNTLFFLLSAFCSISSFAGTVSIIPKPMVLTEQQGTFLLDSKTEIISEGKKLGLSADFLNQYLKKYYGFQLHMRSSAAGMNASKTRIVLRNNKTKTATIGAYQLEVSKSAITITGDNEEGVFYGIQSLIQLLPTTVATSLSIPAVSIKDAPRFQYRGLHLDVGRHFYSVDYLKKYIDFIALHKMNVFHWHLTEDQGWRIEIKKYPKLTEVGSCREGTQVGGPETPTAPSDHIKYCGFYTQKQVREVVKYAADRFITVIPEIEMPGHATAALAAYPYLGCTGGPYQVQTLFGVFKDVYCPGKETTFKFLENVLDEVIALFPSKYIHIGGDECVKDSWKDCASCQKLIRDLKLGDEKGLQSYFVQRIEKYLNSKGRKIIGWDEILEGGLAPNATVMSWQGTEGGIAAAKQGHDVIMTPLDTNYFDHSQSKHETLLTQGGYLPVENVYQYEPVPAVLTEKEQKHILGTQGNVWTEYMENEGKLEHMVFPRVSALSEVLWTEPKNKNWDEFQARLKTQFKRYDLWKVNYNTQGIKKEE